jgi:hypothetical protein
MLQGIGVLIFVVTFVIGAILVTGSLTPTYKVETKKGRENQGTLGQQIMLYGLLAMILMFAISLIV